MAMRILPKAPTVLSQTTSYDPKFIPNYPSGTGNIFYRKSLPEAEEPFKERPSDIGWDLTLVSRCDGRLEDTVGDESMFDTGIVVMPPPGWYVEIYARSSLGKHGYMMTNAVGIIDPEYRGTVKVSLYKFKETRDIELPFRGVQMVLRHAEYSPCSLMETPASEYEEPTNTRGTKGFGSTGHGPKGKAAAPAEEEENPAYSGTYSRRAGARSQQTAARSNATSSFSTKRGNFM